MNQYKNKLNAKLEYRITNFVYASKLAKLDLNRVRNLGQQEAQVQQSVLCCWMMQIKDSNGGYPARPCFPLVPLAI